MSLGVRIQGYTARSWRLLLSMMDLLWTFILPDGKHFKTLFYIHKLIHLPTKYLLSACYISGTVLNSFNIIVNMAILWTNKHNLHDVR